MHFRTRAIHVGNKADARTGAVVPPVHFASTFVQPGSGEWGQFDYSRSGNPTRKALEETLASLENGAGALAFSSGMAAIHAVTMLLRPGDHIVAGSDIYGGTYRQYPVARTVQSRGPRTSGSSYVTYTRLPQNYAGSAYYYNNRYYAGGRYEPGRYTYQGRTYNSRYYHNGQYLYGGSHRQPTVQQVSQVQQVRRGQVQRVRPRSYGY